MKLLFNFKDIVSAQMDIIGVQVEKGKLFEIFIKRYPLCKMPCETCVACHSSCSTCAGPLATDCLICNTGRYRKYDNTC
jgi:hypothetical protein